MSTFNSGKSDEIESFIPLLIDLLGDLSDYCDGNGYYYDCKDYCDKREG